MSIRIYDLSLIGSFHAKAEAHPLESVRLLAFDKKWELAVIPYFFSLSPLPAK